MSRSIIPPYMQGSKARRSYISFTPNYSITFTVMLMGSIFVFTARIQRMKVLFSLVSVCPHPGRSQVSGPSSFLGRVSQSWSEGTPVLAREECPSPSGGYPRTGVPSPNQDWSGVRVRTAEWALAMRRVVCLLHSFCGGGGRSWTRTMVLRMGCIPILPVMESVMGSLGVNRPLLSTCICGNVLI